MSDPIEPRRVGHQVSGPCHCAACGGALQVEQQPDIEGLLEQLELNWHDMTSVPRLKRLMSAAADTIRAQQATIKDSRKAWDDARAFLSGIGDACPICEWTNAFRFGLHHADDCPLMALEKALGYRDE